MKSTTALIIGICLATPAAAQTSVIFNPTWGESSLVVDGHPISCDTNDRTPAQVLQCKVDYWTGEVKSRQEKADKATKLLETAKDTLRTFQALQPK